MMADQGMSLRDYKKGNWTVSETVVLIEAKKMDDERRMKRSNDSEGRSKPTELRWKWVEDYCWRKGCLRSQNQCNDKWDNLMRDYKKVRDYERRITAADQRGDGNDGGGVGVVSYWKLEKNERKERNLPSNMLPQIYEALVDVVERKGGQRMVVAGGGGPSASSNPNINYVVVETPISTNQPSVPSLLQHQVSTPITILSPPPPPPPPPSQAQPPPPPPPPYSQPLPTMYDSSDSHTSEYSDSPAKRRRRGSDEARTSGAASASTSHEVGTAISKSATIIAEAIQGCKEREERRHRDLLSLHERRLEIEESKTEINRQGINGLVDAINKLANSILALASNKNQYQSAPK